MAGTYNIKCEQGATFARVLNWRNADGSPISIVGYSAKMQVRESKAATAVVLELSSANGGITLGGAAGTITLSATATSTTALAIGSYVYDLELTGPDGVVTRLIEGAFLVDGEVTK